MKKKTIKYTLEAIQPQIDMLINELNYEENKNSVKYIKDLKELKHLIIARTLLKKL